MSHLESFRKNVVSDGRSYSDETFEKAAKILNSSKKGVQVSGESIEKFGVLVAQLKVLKAAVQEEEVSTLFSFSLISIFVFYSFNSTTLPRSFSTH